MTEEALQGSKPALPADPTGAYRLHELDSLRGLAAFSVVLYHFHLSWSSTAPLPPAWERHLLFLTIPLYAGSEAVIMFFLLSGIVLALPYVRGKSQAYPIYLIRRILRIYGPYLAALALGVLGAALYHDRNPRNSWNAIFWSEPVDLRLVLSHVLFLGKYRWNQYDFVFWSLIQEMRISILFPLLAMIGLRLRWAGTLVTAAALSALAYFLIPGGDSLLVWVSGAATIHIASIFLFGIVLANNLANIRNGWNRYKPYLTSLLGVVCFFVYFYGSAFRSSPISQALRDHRINTGQGFILNNLVTALGAIGLILVSLNAKHVRAFLSLRPVRFLGRISYSLYLVHPLVLLTVTFSIRDRLSTGIQFAIYLFAAISLAWLFCLAVEEPFIGWGRRVSQVFPRSGAKKLSTSPVSSAQQ